LRIILYEDILHCKILFYVRRNRFLEESTVFFFYLTELQRILRNVVVIMSHRSIQEFLMTLITASRSKKMISYLIFNESPYPVKTRPE